MPSSRRIFRAPKAHILVRPPTRPSNGAQVINQLLDNSSRLSRRDPVPKQYKHVVNWGNPTPFTYAQDVVVLNPPAAIAKAINKITALQTMRDAGVSVPDFTTTPPEDRQKSIWLARKNVTGSAGAGIEVVRKDDPFPQAPLYVKYVRKTTELRVHVAFGKAILVQYKLRKNDNEQNENQKLIRNHDNGWVFAPRELDSVTQDVLQTACDAVAALGLDFGAVDLVIGRDDNKPYVLEVNTAPGLDGPTTVKAWSSAFKEGFNL